MAFIDYVFSIYIISYTTCFINPETVSRSISSINGVTIVLFNVYIRNVRELVWKSMHDSIPWLSEEARTSQRRKIAAMFATTKPSTFTRSTHYAYCKFIGRATNFANMFAGVSREKGTGRKKKREEKRKLMHGCTRERNLMRMEKKRRQKDRERTWISMTKVGYGDEVCRNILQPKPINKRRLGRRIKTHTSRYWLRVAAFQHFLVSAKLRVPPPLSSFYFSFTLHLSTRAGLRADFTMKLIPIGYWLEYNFAIAVIFIRYDRWMMRAF